MTLEEKEQNLIEEIDFFNKNAFWWGQEFERVSQQINQLENSQNNQFGAVPNEEMDKLIASLTYLAGKANTEKKTATMIEKKLNRLRLEKELEFIQGNFEISKKKIVDSVKVKGPCKIVNRNLDSIKTKVVKSAPKSKKKG